MQEVDWTGCDLVEVVPVVCVKGTQIPARFVIAQGIGTPLDEIIEGVIDPTVAERIIEFANTAPAYWTDVEITITLSDDDIADAHGALEFGVIDDEKLTGGIEAKLGPSLTLTHQEAECLRGALEHRGHVLGRDYPIAEQITEKLTQLGIVLL